MVYRNADELSDLSENDAASDISLDEDDDDDDSVDYDVEGVLEQITEEDEGDDDGYFNREGHFVVSERVKAAQVGSGVKRPMAHSEAQTDHHTSSKKSNTVTPTTSQAVDAQSKSQPKQKRTVELSVQTDLQPQTSSASHHGVVRPRADDIDVPPLSPTIADVDPVFVLKPEKLVTVMEGEAAQFSVEVDGTQPIGKHVQDLCMYMYMYIHVRRHVHVILQILVLYG